MTREDLKVAGGMSLPAVVGVVFVILKLIDEIDWSWWWVTAPFWGPLALIVLLALVFVGTLTYKAIKH